MKHQQGISLAVVYGTFLLIAGAAPQTSARKSNVVRRDVEDLAASSSGSPASLSQPSTGGKTSASDEGSAYLVVVEELQNQTLVSGDRATFRCKVDAKPADNLVFLWYKDNQLLDTNDWRIKLRNKTWGSRLQIDDVFSTDSGLYRCEASNRLRRVHTSAHLTVSFNIIPGGGANPIDQNLLKGKCEKYSGYACEEYLSDKLVFVDPFANQAEMEEHVNRALSVINTADEMTARCQRLARSAFCYFVFPPCDGSSETKVPKPQHLCREDCELLKYDICRAVFINPNPDSALAVIANNANCTSLPATATSRTRCTRIGLPRVVDDRHRCYNDSGAKYRGSLSVAFSGESCRAWPVAMVSEYPELAGGHNFCRNPGNEMTSPWCYVRKQRKVCQVPKCQASDQTSLVMILIPAVSVPLLLGCLTLVFCFACKRRRKSSQQEHTRGIKLDEKKLVSAKKAKVPELSAKNVHVVGELGEGKFGKIFKAQVLGNLHYCPNEPVAVKTLISGSTAEQDRHFQREMEMFSDLQHQHVACLKAVVVEPSLRCMIFEYTSNVDLHQHLIVHSPNSDFNLNSSNPNHVTSPALDIPGCVRIATQIASGMEYLTSKNFIHRDLAARNVLVCPNMDMKISNLGVIHDSYLTCYYRSPQGGQMLPIRWMAPESLQNWQFSDKSAVWSFGVLLWEIVSYGQQPYCGYSNHEVLEMISRRQLLTCPDQCPAKVYSLMHECWAEQPQDRPTFKEIYAKLSGWETTSVARMTSQLAQGIHRQLGVRSDERMGVIQYNSPQQGIMVDGFNMHNRAAPQSYPTSTTASDPGNPMLYHAPQAHHGPPPQYANAGYQQQHAAPQQQFYSQPQQQQQPVMLGAGYLQQHPASHYSSSQSRSSASSPTVMHHLPIQAGGIPHHHHGGHPLHDHAMEAAAPQAADGDAPRLTRLGSSSTGGSDERPRNSHRSSGGPLVPLTIFEDGPRSSDARPPIVAPKPLLYYNTKPGNGERDDVTMMTSSTPANSASDAVGDSATGDAKATSCDSGLPQEECDSEGADSHRPLLHASSPAPDGAAPQSGALSQFRSAQTAPASILANAV